MEAEEVLEEPKGCGGIQGGGGLTAKIIFTEEKQSFVGIQSLFSTAQPPPSYDQVIQEKTREEHIVRPTAAPRRSASCTANAYSTQTDPAKEQSAGPKPQKPPRTSLSRPEHLSENDPPKSQERVQSTRSVTVHLEETAQPQPTSVSASQAKPVPLPRMKPRKQTQDNVESLIRFEDDDIPSNSINSSSNEYLKELLGAFDSSGDRGYQEERVLGEMYASVNKRNSHAHIQSFEIQTAPEDWSGVEPIKPLPIPRKPPKPLPPTRSMSFQDGQNVSNQDLTPIFTPQTQPKSAAKPLRDELETLLSKGGPPLRTRPVLTRGNSVRVEEPPLPPRPPAKPPKEPLKANLNVNNHNSTAVLEEDIYTCPAPNPPHVMAKPPVRRRPTTIRVPSQIATESLQGKAPPPLPARNPVGLANAARLTKQKALPSIPTETTSSNRPLPALPNQQKSTVPPKPGPGRPPAPKLGPGRPPPPKPTKGFVLPPRPVQGHQLYDKYNVPHETVASDLNRNRSDELTFQAESPAGRQENGLTVQATHDFTPEGPGELGLKSGDVIKAVERVDGEWYRGTCKGSTGYFPVNFVKVLPGVPPKPVPEKRPKPLPTKFIGPKSFELDSESAEVSPWAMGDGSRIFPDNPPSAQQKSRTPSTRVALPGMAKCSGNQPEAVQPAQSSVEWALARHDFNGESANELSFSRGDRILVTRHVDDQWSAGRLDGKEGIFPKSFVESCQGTGSTSSHQLMGRAMYEFTSDSVEELSLQVGDIITNLESMDDEWFLGDLRGKRALVPKNYVQVL
nr:SH3 domain-containing protein 19-like [Nerophis lumbriciformis]